MLTGMIDLRSLVASKTQLNAALQRQRLLSRFLITSESPTIRELSRGVSKRNLVRGYFCR